MQRGEAGADADVFVELVVHERAASDKAAAVSGQSWKGSHWDAEVDVCAEVAKREMRNQSSAGKSGDVALAGRFGRFGYGYCGSSGYYYRHDGIQDLGKKSNYGTLYERKTRQRSCDQEHARHHTMIVR